MFNFSVRLARGCVLVSCVGLSLSLSGYSAGAHANLAQSENEAHIARIVADLPPNMVKAGEPIHGKSLAQAMAEDHVTAVSIAVIRNGHLAWSRTFGTLSKGGPSATPDTLFQAGSVSKAVAATAALHLVQEGKLSLDADVNDFLVHWKLPASAKSKGKPATLRELLSHTAGVSVHGFPGYLAGKPVPTLLQILDGQPPASNPPLRIEAVPGKQWDYSGGGYLVMQQMVSDVTGRPFADTLRETVLRPYGMNHSSYWQQLPINAIHRAAVPYDRDGTPIAGGSHTYPELAAAGLWTTATDLARFLLSTQQAIAQGNAVLSAPSAREMVTPGLGNWGLGLAVGGQPDRRYFWHGGANEGYESLMTAYEGHGDGAVIMTNANGGLRLANDVMRSIAREYNWPDWGSRIVHVVPVDPARLQSYVGVYRINQWFSFSVTLHDGKLFIQGTGQPELEMWPESNTRFTFVVDVDLEFVRNADGKIIGMDVFQDGRTQRAAKQ